MENSNEKKDLLVQSLLTIHEKYKDDPRNLANNPKFKHLQKEDFH